VGSTFSVVVPKGETTEETTLAHGQLDRLAGSNPTVLLVDDDAAIVDSTQMLLQVCGMTVHTALSGPEALEIIRSGLRPDVLISDYRLPGPNGVEVVRSIREMIDRIVPTVILTGDTSAKEIEAANLPDCTVLQKPANSEVLIEWIRRSTDSTR